MIVSCSWLFQAKKWPKFLKKYVFKCNTLYTLAIKIQCLKLVAVCDYYGDYSKSTENYLLKQMKT